MAESLVVSYRSRAPVGLQRRFLHQNNCHSLPLPKPLLSLTLKSPLSLKCNSVSTLLHRRVISCPAPAALDSDVPHTLHEGSVKHGSSKSFEQWDSLTAKFSGAASIPFLLLQLPQIILNASNLLAGNKTALLAVPWLGMCTGLLGNLSLLSYFTKKRENEVIIVQTLGVLSQFVVFAQLALAEAMPLPYFVATSIVVAAGLVLNFMNYFHCLNSAIWRLWEDFITVGGLSVLPQARTGKLSEKGVKFVGAISGWTATLLFMWMPVAQMWTNFLNPDNIKGLSTFSMLLAMMGNGLMIPRALFMRDFMWFLGSTWATLFYGYGNILCLYCFNAISRECFFAATTGLFLWIGMALWKDTVVYGYDSPFTSLKELVFGS
ncbi:maltose excess protein 1, chloroplastic-like isoform X2 [Juglans microcarpa x Juglans regia]|uniref:maltose excess protein 1, chloroplastic-like isoform X2 n=1 Tax=Juglans microcarpa x Juglans regia TaxID=2249226 RepID=UPI001B7E27A7|nr:maltose excess protein 1, chloroplastic-like isoform X2 [Juglans microcarpa x Juglans regia]